MIRRMRASLPLLMVPRDAVHGAVWRLLALPIPLVLALAAPVRWTIWDDAGMLATRPPQPSGSTS
jgi:hypothetical protein